MAHSPNRFSVVDTVVQVGPTAVSEAVDAVVSKQGRAPRAFQSSDPFDGKCAILSHLSRRNRFNSGADDDRLRH